MGGSSSSNSSSSNTTTTENYDQRVAVERGGIGIGAKAVVDVVATDYGAIQGASDALAAGLKGSANALDVGLSGARDALGTGLKAAFDGMAAGFSFAGDTVNKVTEAFSTSLEKNTAILGEKTSSDAKQISILAIKIFGAVAAAALIFMTFRGRK